MRLHSAAAVTLAVSALSSPALAQVTMDRNVIGSGGGTSIGGSIVLTGTIGQGVTEKSDDGGPLSICSGFWCVKTDACSAADIASQGGALNPDGQITVDDLIQFLSAFFANNLGVADIATLGGAIAPDGQLTVDDLTSFLAVFFAGC